MDELEGSSLLDQVPRCLKVDIIKKSRDQSVRNGSRYARAEMPSHQKTGAVHACISGYILKRRGSFNK